MSYDGNAIAEALAAILSEIDATVPAFAQPPETVNPPAYIVGLDESVEFDVAGFGMDLARLPVICCAGPFETARVRELRDAAKAAVDADRTLGGLNAAVTGRSSRNPRLMTIAGAQLLALDLILEIRQ
jgi:hypothetical protein